MLAFRCSIFVVLKGDSYPDCITEKEFYYGNKCKLFGCAAQESVEKG